MSHSEFHKFSSGVLVLVGLMLLFGPKQWFPSFYHPLYMGITALFSPFLIFLSRYILIGDTVRKRQLINEISSVSAFAILMNVAGELGLFQLYRFGFEYDKFSHCMVSMAFVFILCEAFSEWNHWQRYQTISVVGLAVFGFGVVWEIIEFSSDLFFGTQEWGVYGKDAISDTVKDIGFNTLGIVAGIIVFIIPKKARYIVS